MYLSSHTHRRQYWKSKEEWPFDIIAFRWDSLVVSNVSSWCNACSLEPELFNHVVRVGFNSLKRHIDVIWKTWLERETHNYGLMQFLFWFYSFHNSTTKLFSPKWTWWDFLYSFTCCCHIVAVPHNFLVK